MLPCARASVAGVDHYSQAEPSGGCCSPAAAGPVKMLVQTGFAHERPVALQRPGQFPPGPLAASSSRSFEPASTRTLMSWSTSGDLASQEDAPDRIQISDAAAWALRGLTLSTTSSLDEHAWDMSLQFQGHVDASAVFPFSTISVLMPGW